jgi:hypothetical protein
MVENAPTFASLETITRIHDALGWLTARGAGFRSDLVPSSYVPEPLVAQLPGLNRELVDSYTFIASQDPASCPIPGRGYVESCSAVILKAEDQYGRGPNARYNLYFEPQDYHDKRTHTLTRTLQLPAGWRSPIRVPRGPQQVPQAEADTLLEFLLFEYPTNLPR